MDTEYVNHLAGRRRDPTARLSFARGGFLFLLFGDFLFFSLKDDDRLGLSAPAGTAPCSRGAPRRGARRTRRRGEPRSSRSASDARSPPARFAFRSPVPPFRSWLIRRLLAHPLKSSRVSAIGRICVSFRVSLQPGLGFSVTKGFSGH